MIDISVKLMGSLAHPSIFAMPQVVAARGVTARQPEDLFDTASGQAVLRVGVGTGNLARMLRPDTTYLTLSLYPDSA